MSAVPNIIWPLESQIIRKNDLIFYRSNKLPLILGRLIKYGRLSAVTMCVVYYLTYNFIVPNLEIISKQRKKFNLQVLLQTRQLLKDIGIRLNNASQHKTVTHAQSIVKIAHLRTIAHKVSAVNDVLGDSASECANLIKELRKKIQKQMENDKLASQILRSAILEQKAIFHKTILELKKTL
ncbi:hypothetical protein QEN19_004371 [Hanseniaspora menglaensis]